MSVAMEPVATLGQAQELRALRNECRHWMTGDTAEITVEQQHEFFRIRVTPGKVRAWLLRMEGRAVAYALLWPGRGGTQWLSCGVAGDARGQGLGILVVALTVMAAGGPVQLEVWADNDRARRTYTRCGFKTIGTHVRGGRVLEVMEAR